jgi:PadR family transcriptional regulator PadR
MSMPGARRNSPQTQAVLDVLAEHPSAWTYGYQLSKLTGLKSGTMYPLLMRLSDRGYLDEKWEASDAPNRPRRHLYRLSQAGMALARQTSEQVLGESGKLQH